MEHIYAMLSMSRGQNLKGAIVTFNGTLIITFTTKLRDVSILKRFFRTIAKDGVDIALETNEYFDDEETDDKVTGSKEDSNGALS